MAHQQMFRAPSTNAYYAHPNQIPVTALAREIEAALPLHNTILHLTTQRTWIKSLKEWHNSTKLTLAFRHLYGQHYTFVDFATAQECRDWVARSASDPMFTTRFPDEATA